MLFQLKFRCLRLRHFERRGEWDKRINQERITSHGQTVYWIICCSWNDSGIVKIFEISFYAFKWTIAVRLILSSLPHIRAHFRIIELLNDLRSLVSRTLFLIFEFEKPWLLLQLCHFIRKSSGNEDEVLKNFFILKL